MRNNQQVKKADQLDVKVLTVVLILSIFEFELFTFARGPIEEAGRDAWISILIGSSILLFTTFLLVKLARRFPQENLFQILVKVWGKPLGLLLTIAYLLYWLVFLTLLFQEFTTANRTLFLQETPVLIPMVLMALGAVWLASYGLTAIVRFFQIMFPFVAFFIVFLLILGLKDIRLQNFLPVFGEGYGPIMSGAIRNVGFPQGLEVILFISPFLSNHHQALKPALLGASAVVLFSFFSCITAIGILGAENIQEAIWPGLAAVSVIQLPGFPVERYELFLTLPWLVSIFTTMCIFIYLLSYGVMFLFSLNRGMLVRVILATLIIIGAYLIPNHSWTMSIRQSMNYFTITFVAAIPILTLILASIRQVKGEENA